MSNPDVPRAEALPPPSLPMPDPFQPVGPAGPAEPVAGQDSARPEPWYVRRGPIARFNRWADADWPAERIARVVTAFVILAGCTVAMSRIIHLDLLVRDTTPTGGDMGAHVLAPAELRDNFLPWQLSGWSNSWYAGFPLYRFYMVIPALMIVALNVILPYGIAFKIVTVLGLLTLCWCCWAFGRLCRFAFPIPELMALAGLAFMLDEKFYLLGGNVKSTMAGEFSFSIALSFAILGLGLFARGLETGKYRARAAILLALAMLSHGIVMIFVVLAALIWLLVWLDRKRLWYGLAVIGGAGLLAAFWAVPFVLNHQYMTDMKYEPYTGQEVAWNSYFPWSRWLMALMMFFCVAGFVISVVRRQLHGVALGILLAALFLGYWLAERSLPVIGLLWNPRVLPFLYFTRLLLTMVGIVEVVRLIVRAVRRERVLPRRAAWVTGVAVAAVVTIFVGAGEAVQYRVYPFSSMKGNVYHFGLPGWHPFHLKDLTPSGTNKGKPRAYRASADGWTTFNFRGYEGLAQWGEYREIMLKLREIGASNGCGRLEWEHQHEGDEYGTSMALMLTGFWTDGCVNSMEGVYFEASGTTPYHFLTAAVVSQQASNPVRGLPYDSFLRLDLGYQYMRSLGVRYLMVYTQAAKEAAAREPGFELVATVGPWRIFQIPDTQLAEGLKVQPVVVNERDIDRREDFLEVGISWLQKHDRWAAIPAFDGPADWQRVDVAPDENDNRAGVDRNAVWVYPQQEIEPQALAPVTVSNFRLGKQDLSFDVDRVGVPVLVRVSYFPNWSVEGAEGPYHAGANQMIVIPTSTHVSMSFDRSGIDYLAYLLTLLGIALLVFLRYRVGDVCVGPSPLPVEEGPDVAHVRYAPPPPFDVVALPPPVDPGTSPFAADAPPPSWRLDAPPVLLDDAPPPPVRAGELLDPESPDAAEDAIEDAAEDAGEAPPATASEPVADRDPTPMWTEPTWAMDPPKNAPDQVEEAAEEWLRRMTEGGDGPDGPSRR